jgi:hypothetical protein
VFQPTSIQPTNEVLTVATAAQWIQGARLRTLPAAELLMLPNGKPDRLGMTVLLDALHQGK